MPCFKDLPSKDFSTLNPGNKLFGKMQAKTFMFYQPSLDGSYLVGKDL
jgi:hypothetical protein